MATIVVTQSGTTVAVSNGDRVVIDIPGGGDVTVVAASSNTRNFQVSFTDDSVSDTLRVDLTTFQRNGLQMLLRDYDPTDRVSLIGNTSGGVDPKKSNEYDFTYTGADGGSYDGRLRILDPGERDLNAQPPPIMICFGTGTIIDTDLGPRTVESLTLGDLIDTADRGLQPLRWIGRRHLGAAELKAMPQFAPIRVTAGALGDGLPWTDLILSPQHRVWLSGWKAELLFGEPEVLAPIKALVDGQRIAPAPMNQVTYHHLLFDRHEIVRSNGILSESLHPGEMTLLALEHADLAEIETRVGDLKTRRTARPVLRSYEARALKDVA